MPQLVPYGKAEPGIPSHRCDECGRDIYVWPIPWELAWPNGQWTFLCSTCYFRKKEG